jgi:hypothetical protein
VLKVAAVDLKLAQNCAAHHTDDYELCDPQGEIDEESGKPREQGVVLRRGQDIELNVKFDRAYDVDKDDLKLALRYACESWLLYH